MPRTVSSLSFNTFTRVATSVPLTSLPRTSTRAPSATGPCSTTAVLASTGTPPTSNAVGEVNAVTSARSRPSARSSTLRTPERTLIATHWPLTCTVSNRMRTRRPLAKAAGRSAAATLLYETTAAPIWKVLAAVSSALTRPTSLNAAGATSASMREATKWPLVASNSACTSTVLPARPATPPLSVSSNTVVLRTSTVWPSTTKVAATVSTVATGPTNTLPKRMCCATARPSVSSTAPLSTSTIMPSFSAAEVAALPSSSSTLAALSSKRTPFTMTEPKPPTGPDVKATDDGEAVLPVAGGAYEPPPPQPAIHDAVSSAHAAPSQPDARGLTKFICSMCRS